MTTLIDALVVTLELDPKPFQKGEKEAAQSVTRLKSNTVKNLKEVENESKKAGDSIGRIARQLVGLFAVIAGSRSLVELTKGLTVANAELGRFSGNMEMSPQRVAAWGAAVQRVGGSMDGFSSTLGNISKTLSNFRTGMGELPEAFFQLSARARVHINPLGSTEEVIDGLSEAVKRLSATNRTDAFNLASAIGIDAATFELMRKHGDAIRQHVSEIEKSIAPSNRAIEVAQKLQTAWYKLAQEIGAVINKIYELVGPVMTAALEKMSEWLKANEDWIKQGFVSAVERLSAALGDIDWTRFADGVGSVAKRAESAASSIATIAANLATISTWVTGRPLSTPDANPEWEREWRERLGGGANGLGGGSAQPERPLHPSLMNENLLRGSGGANGLGGGSAFDRLDTRVDGRPVSRANPMPVMLGQGAGDIGSGGSFLSRVLSWVGAAGGGSGSGGPSAPAPTGSGGTVIEQINNHIRKGASTPGWWTAERQKHAYDRLRNEAGLSDAGAKALISRWAHVEASGGPSSVNPTSGAFGIAQWLTKSRLDPIRGNTDYDDQLSHAIWELQNTELRAAAALRNAKTYEEGAVGASIYERAEGYNAATGRDNHVAKTLSGMPLVHSAISGEGGATEKKRFNANVDARLRHIIEETALRTGTQITLNSGMRPGDRRFHGRGKALDISILGPDGKRLPNYQNAEAFAEYEKFAQEARKVQQELYPDLAKKFRWGGYFSGGKGKYGALDLMHFDIGGAGMGGGSWERGLTDEQRRLWPGADSRGLAALTNRGPDVVTGARASALAKNDSSVTNNPAFDTRIGGVTINAPNSDPEAIARAFTDKLGETLKNSFGGAMANYGLR